ncbi:MAG: HNH endonuclease [Bryobacteraceae bacterium]
MPRTLVREPRAVGGGYISADTRLFVWQRDQGRCRNCGGTQDLQFDHIVPRSLGGSGTAQNVELLCKECNQKKRAKLFAPGLVRIASGEPARTNGGVR